MQADILKEDQGQNTCIFSTEFSLKVMGDIQQYFVQNKVRNFYSVSISGYHIAEAGANPISQLAFTLSNGFTFVRPTSRGMHRRLRAEPVVLLLERHGPGIHRARPRRAASGRWRCAKHGANERSQKLKVSHPDQRPQPACAGDSVQRHPHHAAGADRGLRQPQLLHTNAFDEAITTPTEESVRRAMAIQLIINREWGLAKNENPNQGAFIIDELTDLVEAVLREFEAISERGGVLGDGDGLSARQDSGRIVFL